MYATPEPFEHQKEGMAFANARAFSYLAHDPGVGKTRTAVMVLDANADADHALVLCPASVVGVWRQQIAQWSIDHTRKVYVVDSAGFDPHQARPGSITVCSYGMLSRHPALVERLARHGYDLLIVDEAHKLKSPSSKRTKAVLGMRCRNTGLASNCAKVIFLSGTPVLNTPDELWTFLRAFAPEAIGKSLGFDEFRDRYCVMEDRWIGDNLLPYVAKAKRETMPELRKILSPLMHFARWQDVQRNMPPLIWQHFPFALEQMPLEFGEAQRLIVDFMKRDGVDMNDPEQVLSWLKSSAHLATYRRMVGLLKAPLVAEAVTDDFEGGVTKVLLFAHHHEVINRLAQSLKHLGLVTITGATSSKDREAAVYRFQNSDQCGVFLGQTQAAGEGITLTKSNLVYLVEPDYTPAVNYQAAKRAHRTGQHHSVQARMCSLDGSLDAAIAAILTRKCETIQAITGANLRTK